MKSVQKITIITVLFFCAGLASAQTDLLDKTISLRVENTTVKEALKKMESAAGVSFAFGNLPKLNAKVTGNYIDKTLRHILDKLLSPNDLDYKLIGSNIAIFEAKKKAKNLGKNSTKKSGYNVSGYVYDATTGEALIGATVYEQSDYVGTSTNQFGFFSIKLTDGPHTLLISFIGYEEKQIPVTKQQQLKITLGESESTLQEIVVTVDKEEETVQSATIGKMELKVAEINAIPAVAGEVDVLKAVTLLPGIKQGVDAASGFYVRGGSSDQNLILLDGVPLYNPYHLWGFLSTFNSDAINHIELTKGAFPARYGGRLSSVLDITMKDGNNQKWDKELSVGLLSAKAKVSGPVIKDKSSIMVTARRTYADLIVAPIRNSQNKSATDEFKENYNFMDFNLKYNYRFSDKDRLYISGFYSRDKHLVKNTSKTTVDNTGSSSTSERNQGWGNGIASFRWNHLFSQKMFVNTTGYFSNYNYFTEDGFKNNAPDIQQESKIEYSSKINDFGIKQDYEYFASNKHRIRFGAGLIQHYFTPGVNFNSFKTGENDVETKLGNEKVAAPEVDVYVEDEWDVLPKLKLNIGLHGSAFFTKNKNYHSLQPRISTRYLVNDRLSLKLGYSKMTQYMHLLTNSGIAQASDLWVPSTDKVKPQQSTQYAAGAALKLNGWLLELDGYYKEMDNLIEYKDGANYSKGELGWEEQIETGRGNSYGGELFLKKVSGKLTGWLGYTLSWTNRKFDAINFGKAFPYKYDRRHDISLVGNYKQSEKWSFNASWVFYTGNATTIPQTAYVAPNYSGEVEFSQYWVPVGTSISGSIITNPGIIQSSNNRNNYRLPSYHKLDVSATRKWVKTKATHEFTFGLTNLYNRKNPSFVILETFADGSSKYSSRTLFPILPTLNYKISF